MRKRIGSFQNYHIMIGGLITGEVVDISDKNNHSQMSQF